LAEEDKGDWVNLPEFTTTHLDWHIFKEALFRQYPRSRKAFISLADLETFTDERSKKEINNLETMPSF